MDTKGISYGYAIIGLIFIITGVIIGTLANTGTFEQAINSEALPALNTYVLGSIVAFILVLCGILLLVFGHRS